MIPGDYQSPDVCVIGSGPSGLATALRAADAGKRVLIVESGDESNQNDFCRGEVLPSVGQNGTQDSELVPGPSIYRHDYMSASRLRVIGGSSRKWGVRPYLDGGPHVRVARPDVSDFAELPELESPAWPVAVTEISQYLDQAAAFFGIGSSRFEPESVSGDLKLEKDVFLPRYFHIARSPVIFDVNYGRASAHDNIEIATGWNLVELTSDSSKRKIQSAIVANRKNERAQIRPKLIVLACGGVENPRTLLNAIDEGVIKDPYDNAGRWFMDHPHASLGVLKPNSPIEQVGEFHDFQNIEGDWVLGHYGLNPLWAKKNNLPRFSITLVGAPESVASRAASAMAHLMNLKYEKASLTETFLDFAKLASDPVSVVKQLQYKMSKGNQRHHTALGGWSKPTKRVTKVDVLRVEAMLSQRPSRDNRVVLGRDKDAYGKRFPNLHWSWAKKELKAYWDAVELTRNQFELADSGRFFTAKELGCGSMPRANTGWHQMGGAKMSLDPKQGSVDEYCRYHQTDNLYLSGPSIFPNSVGYANPTLTSIAFSLRLGDHLGTL